MDYMNSKIILLIGSIMDKLEKCRSIYLRKKHSSIVNNGGGMLSSIVTIGYPSNIKIGKNSYINGGSIIASENAKIIIGDNCLISYNVHIRTSMHNYKDKNRLINQQGDSEKSIVIGNDVWIGYGAQIMPGVVVRDGCVIGAGAILTESTEPYGVYVGVPAKLLRYRD